jgi:hypothetical protein
MKAKIFKILLPLRKNLLRAGIKQKKSQSQHSKFFYKSAINTYRTSLPLHRLRLNL